VVNRRVPRRRVLIGIQVLVFVYTHKDKESEVHLDFHLTSRFKLLVAVSRVERWVLFSILIHITYN
jgi:hypothetical protein